MDKKKIRLFQSLAVITLILIAGYFVISLKYTASNTSNVSNPPNSSDEMVKINNTISGNIMANTATSAKTLAYTMIVNDDGGRISIPIGYRIEKISYDKNVLMVTTIQLDGSTIIDIMPKSYFTQTKVVVIFSNGIMAEINVVGNFHSDITIIPLVDNITAFIGDTVEIPVIIKNNGISPDVVNVEITPINVKTTTTNDSIYLEGGESEKIVITAKIINSGYGGVYIKADGSNVYIPIVARPPFEVKNYTKEINSGDNITIKVRAYKECVLTVKYNDNELGIYPLSTGENVISIEPPARNVVVIPLQLEACNYSKSLIIVQNVEKREPITSVSIEPIGLQTYVPGTYNVIVRNTGDTRVTVGINVSVQNDAITVEYPENITLSPGSYKVVSFTFNLSKIILINTVATIKFTYGENVKIVKVYLIPHPKPSVDINITPITDSDGIVSARILLTPNQVMKNVRVHYVVKGFYNNLFVSIVDSSVEFETFEETEVILPKFPPTSILIVSVVVEADNNVISQTSKTFVFKKID